MAPLLSWQVCIGHDSQASVSVDAGTSASAEVRRSSTHILNRLHGLLRDVIPSGVPLDLSATKAAALLRTVRTTTATTPAAGTCSPTCGASTSGSATTPPIPAS